MEANAFLETRKQAPLSERIIQPLKAVYTGTGKHPLLTKETAEIGLLLLNKRDDVFPESHYNDFHYKSDRYIRVMELLPATAWNDPVAFDLLIFLFGQEKARYVKYAWEKVPYQMYQQGFARRSFRAPDDPEVYTVNQLNYLRLFISQSFNTLYTQGPPVTTFYDLSVAEQVRYDIDFQAQHLFRIWAAAIDMDNREILPLMADIIYNKDPHGKVTNPIIKALLTSETPAAWELVKQLLLAAQRQEGLRQVIVEALDETSIPALRFMLKVLVDEKMSRFSSVVRALDVWAGLGWLAEKESTIQSFLEKAHTYLESPELIPAAIQSKNNMEVYMALWALGVNNIEDTLPHLLNLYDNGDAEKRCLALLFAKQTAYYKINMPLLYQALTDKDPAVIAMASELNDLICVNAKHYDTYYPELFSRLQAVVQRAPEKPVTYEGRVFSWKNIIFDRENALRAMCTLILDQPERLDVVMTYFDGMSAELRDHVAKIILPQHTRYDFKHIKGALTVTPFQRDFAFRILKDRKENLVKAAFRVFETTTFTDEELPVFTELLKRKGSEVRGKTIELLLRQPDAQLAPLAEQLLQGDTEQRLAGLDIALQLQKQQRLQSQVSGWVTVFQERKAVSAKEEVLLLQLSGESNVLHWTEENGYGLYDPALTAAPVLPAIDPNDLYGQAVRQGGKYGFSCPAAAITKILEGLHELLQQHAAHEYEVDTYGNEKVKVLLGNTFRRVKAWGHTYASKREEFEDYPLSEVWEQWFLQSGLTARDLFILTIVAKDSHTLSGAWSDYVLEYSPVIEEIYPRETFGKGYARHNNVFTHALHALLLIVPYEEKNAFLIGAVTRLFAALPATALQYTPDRKGYFHQGGQGDGWQTVIQLNQLLQAVSIMELKGTALATCWALYHWRQFSGLKENIISSLPPLQLFCRAYEAGIIPESELYRGIISTNNINELSARKKNRHSFDYFKHFPFLQPMYVKVREHFLDIELKRGDSPTPVTHFVYKLNTIYGVKRFCEIWIGLGKTSLYRGYVYSDKYNKQALFSALLKYCFPLETDTPELFNQLVEQAKIKEQQLIEASVYAPQWHKYVSNYLNWKGLDAAIWWMHAHTKTSGYRETNAEAESEIARYSTVELNDFQAGAVDKDWFHKAYKEIGKERWQIVYDAAKYISDGNAHRRARLYADVMTGDLKLQEVTEKVKGKRDQDYLRMYGLIPLTKAKAEKDVLERYAYLQQFKKESKQFGAQRQTSEALALRIAMENLARNAGYADPQRLTWAMETKQVQEILAKETQVKYDDVLIGLVIDEEGEADVVAFKNDKQLKAIPPKLKKDAKVLELGEFKKTLREQLKRAKGSLEEAMVRGDQFLLSELQLLFGHPVISKHLERLVFVAGEKHGLFKNGVLESAKGEVFKLTDSDKIRVAHCSDLYANGAWTDYQHYYFEHSIRQPFKQVFRELYVPLEEELQEAAISRRYAGHQVQPSQTVALLKSRGWKVDYEEGLQKVFHKEGFAAKMYAMADWFSPAEVESPTLETVVFQDLKTWKNVPFKDISPLIFSEVMRDIDLVVSVAHVGGVDPEASHSSIEMRTALLRETLRLFKLDNVTINGTHAMIKGKLGEYSVHMGSAVVHQLPGKYLSILPVHSQHRGRLFLPFVDDDPRSAELISKILLLARDHEIQDPTVLRQLN